MATQPTRVTIQKDIPQLTIHENKTLAKTTQPNKITIQEDILISLTPLIINSGKSYLDLLTTLDPNSLTSIQAINKVP